MNNFLSKITGAHYKQPKKISSYSLPPTTFSNIILYVLNEPLRYFQSHGILYLVESTLQNTATHNLDFSFFFNLLTLCIDYSRYDDKYTLYLSVKDPKSKTVRETKSKKSCANFVTVNGIVCQDLVENEVTKLHNSLLSERKEKQ